MAKTKGTFVVPRNFDHEGKRFATKVNESIAQLKGELGDPLDGAVTFRDLIDAGIAKRDIRIGSNGRIVGLNSKDVTFGDEEVLGIPPAPTGVSADGAFQNIVIEWDVPTFFGFSHAEVWAATSNTFADRVFIGQTTAAVFAHQVGNGQTRYYWIRFVNIQGTVGPFNSTTGTQASTAEDIGAVMQDLSETLQDLPGYTTLEALISGSAGTAATVIRNASEPSTRDNGDALVGNDIWIDTDDNNQAYFRNSGNTAWVKSRDSTLISLYNSLSSTVSTNTSNISTAQSDIITLTSDTTANASAITSLTSTVNTNTSNISTNASAISTEATTRANADSALSTSITNLSSTVSGNTASITSLNTTTANINGDLDAMYVLTVATESNGSKSAAGMVIGSNANSGSGAQSYVQFQADKFAIWSGSTNIAPFIVSGGVVYIDDARIQNGAITNAKIGNLAVDSAKIANLAVVEAKIANAAITNAKIDDAAISTAKIQDAAINNAKINDLDASKINAGTISADRIGANSITAAKINTTDLFLPSNGGEKGGTTLGYWHENDLNYRHVAEIGEGSGFYTGYIRVYKGVYAGQIKSISFLISDGTYGAGSGYDVNTSVTFTDITKITESASHAILVTPDLVYLTGTWISESRLTTGKDSSNIPLSFRYTGTGTLNIFIYAQGDSNFQLMGGADARFIKFST